LKDFERMAERELILKRASASGVRQASSRDRKCAIEIATDQHEFVSGLALEVLRSIEAMQVPPDVRSAILLQSAQRALKIA
jgi:hypothetical protein